VKLLDEGDGIDPLEKYNFGKAAKYLFRPCVTEDGSPDEECTINLTNPITLTPDEVDAIVAIKNGQSIQSG
jgi:hypothetical protein